MSLISNQFDGLYGGVNQQSAEQRLSTQVEEMINAYPTLDRGLLKRNPTQKLTLDAAITLNQTMYSYEYDRGASNGDEEKYTINIVDGDMEIVNVLTGVVYKDTHGLTYEAVAKDYLTPFGGSNGYASTTIKDTTFITNKLVSPQLLTGAPTDNTYLKEGYIWIKSANPASAYTYTVTVTDDSANSVVASNSSTTTTAAATALAATIDADANFSATAVGSVIKVIGVNNLSTVDAGDSWGNQASFGWAYKVQFNTDLPKNLGFDNAIVKITGSGTSVFATYWLTYADSQWQETKDPNIAFQIDEKTMPHVLIRNTNDTFTFKKYGGWSEGLVGDNDTNPSPSFIETVDNVEPTIKDIFFFKNRLGFITERTVVLSEVGEYGNFWRTTTAAVLDSDYIDATVDTTKVISLEYATYLEDAMMLFSDKAQFKLEGGRVLSPKDVQISQTSAYEINTNVRPLFMNDKVFFCAVRGDYSAVMQYEVNTTSATSEAVDITAHVQTYIPNTITKLSGSPINNMLFLTSNEEDDSIWVYKYYDDGADRVQSAWFKWTYNGKIYHAFSLGRNLNIMINRNNAVAAVNWVVGTGFWDMSKLWDNSQVWVMNEASLDAKDQFETTPIFPQEYTGDFLDDFTTEDNETIIPTVVRIGEWVASSRGSKDIRGHLKFKTVQISSEEGSEFNLVVEDVARNTTRTIKSKYTVKRKPMIYGDAKNIRISITNSNVTGFRINTVSYEGTLTKRDSRR